MDIVQIVWLCLIGMGAALGLFLYNQRFLSELVRKLDQMDAVSPDTALTLEELHCKQTPQLKHALREDGPLRASVGTTDGKHFYLLPEKRDMALHKYGKSSMSIPYLLLCWLALLLFGCLFSYIYPYAAEFATNFLK